VIDWQKLACALATRGAFSIVTGGPGTGKTTTVVRLLALLQAPAVEAGNRCAFVSPPDRQSGGAPDRIHQSASQNAESHRRRAPENPFGCHHRAPSARQPSRHATFPSPRGQSLAAGCAGGGRSLDDRPGNDGQPARRAAAHARLVLLGDKDQLASVEAGAVLGDLCRDAEAGWYSPQTRQWLEAVSGESLAASGLQEDLDGTHPLAQQVVMLRHSRRFGEGSGIGQLARWVNQQQPDEARSCWRLAAMTMCFPALKNEQDRALERLLLDGHGEGPQGYRHYLSLLRNQRPALDRPLDDPCWMEWARDVLQAFDAFQLLCAVRKGPWGVEGLNRRSPTRCSRPV
jgi:exodeoxyribonuclease V alpha subunit